MADSLAEAEMLAQSQLDGSQLPLPGSQGPDSGFSAQFGTEVPAGSFDALNPKVSAVRAKSTSDRAKMSASYVVDNL
eukprot:8130192-Pyramimonas_sp.AAC.1